MPNTPSPKKTHHIATSDPQYSHEETQFLKLVDEYRRTHDRPFVTHVEIYRLLKEQGFHLGKRFDPTDPNQIPIVRQTQRLMTPTKDV